MSERDCRSVSKVAPKSPRSRAHGELAGGHLVFATSALVPGGRRRWQRLAAIFPVVRAWQGNSNTTRVLVLRSTRVRSLLLLRMASTSAAGGWRTAVVGQGNAARARKLQSRARHVALSRWR
jgi:hypothetical protein